MSISESTARQLLKEYFEDYRSDDRFLYSFGGEQFLVLECTSGSGGVSKNGIIDLINEYFDGYKATSNYIIDMEGCHFLIALQMAIIKKLPKSQIRLTKDVSDDSDSSSSRIFDSQSPGQKALIAGFGEGVIL